MESDGIVLDVADKCEEGCVYASSIGIFDDSSEENNDVTEIQSVSFNDLMHETSTEVKRIEVSSDYVYIRNIKSVYMNPIRPVAILDKGIKIVDPKTESDGDFYNHSTINDSLDDGFAGLVLRDPRISQVQREFIMHPEKNSLTKLADPMRSLYTIFSVPVTKSEKKEIGKMIINALNNSKINYSIITNFIIGAKLITQNSINFIKNLFDFSSESKHFDSNNLVCSTFVAYILAKCCPNIKREFVKHPFDLYTITPNQLVDRIPGCKRCFHGIWSMYDEDKMRYIENNKRR